MKYSMRDLICDLSHQLLTCLKLRYIGRKITVKIKNFYINFHLKDCLEVEFSTYEIMKEGSLSAFTLYDSLAHRAIDVIN